MVVTVEKLHAWDGKKTIMDEYTTSCISYTTFENEIIVWL